MTIPNPYTKNLDDIVDITVEISPLAAPRPTFNQALIIGTSAVIPVSERLREYEAVADMLEDGFELTDPEYIAAQIYFSQSPAPDTLWVGRKDTGESALEAITACRAANPDWYVGIVLGTVKADHLAIAAWAEAATPPTLYAYTTDDDDVITNVTTDVCSQLKALLYKRTIGQYATTQEAGSPAVALYPNNIYAICAIIGYAMGQNTGLANSAYTLKFKNEVGIATEPLTATMIGYAEDKYCNLYLNYANYYNVFEQGRMANGYFFDEVINLDMLVSNIQLSVMDLLYGNPKIPQTDSGVNQIIHAINEACDQAVKIGFLAPGQWTGADCLNLKTDDMLPAGYLVQAEKCADQSQADREARKSPNIYVAVKEAGAIHSVLIGVYVNR